MQIPFTGGTLREFPRRKKEAMLKGMDLPRDHLVGIVNLPDDGLVPVVPKPEDIKIVVSGGRGPGTAFLVDRWGFGNSRFVTKEIKLPPNWAELVKDLSGWETPIEVK